MVSGRVREMFPGGNTPVGFYSYYDFIIPQDATRIMVIKGGPGVGKSSFMKLIAKEMNETGYDIELHHCSSDNNSLDGIVFPQINIALIDGTSPHIVDPRNPGAVDEIIHLGDYWDEPGVRSHKQDILNVNQEVGRMFQRAYRFLKAAKAIHDDLEAISLEGLDTGKLNQKAAQLKTEIFKDQPVASKPGFIRKLFASAITPEGFKNYIPTLMDSDYKIYTITGQPGSGKSTLLSKVALAAAERGWDCELFYCPFDPIKIEHLIIPNLKIALITNQEPHFTEFERETLDIDLDECISLKIFTKYGKIIAQNQKIKSELLEVAVSFLREAKSAHDLMEQYYIPNMNFAAITELRQKTANRIFGYAAEQGK